MIKKYVLGIDTSNYTTSVALVDEYGEVVANIKRLLPVKAGECGLRQSDAVFSHVKNLQLVMDELREYVGDAQICAIGVSSRPRNVEGSYMPCFLCGTTVAKSISCITGAPIFEFSHQCGHLMAALYSAGKIEFANKPFGAFHVSGGTTEILYGAYSGEGFDVELVGGTKDLNAGQLVDRVGVMLGLGFPCGAELEKLALNNKKEITKQSALVSDCYFNLSGAENMAKKLYEDTNDASYVADFTFAYIGNTLKKASYNLIKKHGDIPIIYAGGVMSNSIIKGMLSKIPGACFAEPRFSSDNAAGIALLTYKKMKNNM